VPFLSSSQSESTLIKSYASEKKSSARCSIIHIPEFKPLCAATLFVDLLGIVHLVGLDEALSPSAFIDTLQTPFGAPFSRHGLVCH
jgi:hypothetical protein